MTKTTTDQGKSILADVRCHFLVLIFYEKTEKTNLCLDVSRSEVGFYIPLYGFDVDATEENGVTHHFRPWSYPWQRPGVLRTTSQPGPPVANNFMMGRVTKRLEQMSAEHYNSGNGTSQKLQLELLILTTSFHMEFGRKIWEMSWEIDRDCVRDCVNFCVTCFDALLIEGGLGFVDQLFGGGLGRVSFFALGASDSPVKSWWRKAPPFG